MDFVKTEIFGVGVTNAREDELVQTVITSLRQQEEPYYIVTPNPEIVMHASTRPDFKRILNQARFSLCDGVGLFLAGKLLGTPFIQRITGVDFMEHLCQEIARWNRENNEKIMTVGFLGGKDGVAEKTAKCLVEKYPHLRICFVGEEWSDHGFVRNGLKQESRSKKHGKVATQTHDSKFMLHDSYPHILFVAFGFPKQEEWMAEHVGKVPVRVMMGVGGAFDYLSGNVSRAPTIVRAIGFEWLYRLIRQPWRSRRQLALLKFIWLVLKTKIARKH